MALALYRRYRPDTFDKVIGQDQVTVPLSRALDRGRLTHAYLFSGPRGCGKTSSARILARCVNCAKGPTSHPCGECDSCKDLANGGPGSIDVVEIDAASHNGVEDARELRERATFAPARDRYKIFILDEAHMVTQQGFNALLKIVEEPPEHVMFIFATTEPDKVIGTIRSRTHHYPFRLVPQEIMGPYLEQICQQEHVTCEPGVLRLTMRAGGGSVRDTLSILDQLMVGSVDGVLSHDVAVALLGFTPDALIAQAIDAVIERDGEGLYGVVQKVVVGGYDPRRFVEDLLARVRDLLVLTIGGEHAERVLSDDAAVDDVQQLHTQAAALGLHALSAMAETINTALAAMTGAVSPRMRLELLAARLLAGRDPETVSEVRHDVARPSAQPPVASRHEASQRTAPASSPSGGTRAGFAGAARQSSPQSAPTGGPAPTAKGEPAPAQSSDSGRTEATAAPVEPESALPAGGNAAADTDAAHGSAAASPDAHNGVASAGNAPHDDERSVEERWAAVLSALPQDVREYVDGDRVTNVALSVGRNGRRRLSMTFDRAISQHAFALALSSDAAHSGSKASAIVLHTVRQVFGEDVMIAPTKVAANGERVEPTSRMAPERLAQVKRQIALAKAGLANTALAAAASRTKASAEQGKESKTPAGAASSDADDPSHPRAGVANDRTGDDDDPWFRPVSARSSVAAHGVDAGAETSPAGAAHRDAVRPGHDGSAHTTHAPAVAGANGGAGGAGHHKHVAVPDMSDDTDPWAIPALPGGVAPEGASSAVPPSSAEPAQNSPTASAPQGPSAVRASSVAAPFPVSQQAASSSSASVVPDGGVRPMDSGSSATPSPDMGANANRGDPVRHPQVAPEDDVYSLSDKSLDSTAAMDIAQIAKMFDVKQVEDFAADDPHNPKNAQPANKHQEG
ncbi:MAG: DNA polymerase III subunit gamma/tau [Bifidobacterium mongoliense]|nr:DNA polymerase III subunit gamma/tau [Bifidobacterium mongoliense]